MLPVLMLTGFAGLLPESMIDTLVSKRVVVVERKVLVALAVRTGDPLGSREDGTLKTLSEPKLVIGHKRTGLVRAGGRQAVPNVEGEVVLEPVGISVEVTPVLRLDGKILLDAQITETEVSQGRGLNTKHGFVPGIDSRSIRYSASVSQGQRVKVRVSSRSDSDQTWVELVATVQEEPNSTSAK
jgi:hypothetical protein